MSNLEWIWEPRNRTGVLLTSVGIVLAIATLDWWTKPYVSLGFLYLFPIMLAAGFATLGDYRSGHACALLRASVSATWTQPTLPSVLVLKPWLWSDPDCSSLKSCATVA